MTNTRLISISVVSYRNSTSNHNNGREFWVVFQVVSYRNSTSNHNVWLAKATHKRVVSYRNSTSNHNLDRHFGGQRVVVSYRNSTSNHNNKGLGFVPAWLYLIEILHQTTTIVCTMTFDRRCILSKFYIKPQPFEWYPVEIFGCILSKFYIKPQPHVAYIVK